METIFVLLPLALLIAGIAPAPFIWAARSGPFDDLETPAVRVLFDDEPAPAAPRPPPGGGRPRPFARGGARAAFRPPGAPAPPGPLRRGAGCRRSAPRARRAGRSPRPESSGDHLRRADKED